MKESPTGDELLSRATQYLLGSGVPKKEAKAQSLLVQAAELDNPEALHLAYLMLAHGEGGAFLPRKAFQFLVRAAELGHVEATYSLGFCYMNGGMGNIGYSDEVLQQQVVPVDENQGLELLAAAAAQGHGLAALRIAEYWEGHAKDEPAMLRRAVEWYKKGMALGEPNCLIRLADFHILGKVLPKDRKTARMLYKRAEKADDQCAKRIAEQRLERFDELEALLAEDC